MIASYEFSPTVKNVESKTVNKKNRYSVNVVCTHFYNLKFVLGENDVIILFFLSETWNWCAVFLSRARALSLSHSFSWKFSVFLNLCLFISLPYCLFAFLSLPASKRVNFQLYRLNIAVEFSLFVNLDMWFCYWCFAGRRCYRIVSSEWYSCWWPSAGKYKIRFHFRVYTCHVCPLNNNVTMMVKVVL